MKNTYATSWLPCSGPCFCIVLCLALAGASGCKKTEPDASVADAGAAERAEQPAGATLSAKKTSGSRGRAAKKDGAFQKKPLERLRLSRLPAAALSGSLRFDGKIDRAVGWSDNNGDNVVIFSRKTSRKELKEIDEIATTDHLYVRHYAHPNGTQKELRVVQDWQKECIHRATVGFDWKGLDLTDLDGDGIGELTFAYELACRSDVTPAVLKLLMLENGEKYIVRGETNLHVAGQRYGGGREIDASVLNGPEPFRDHLMSAWERVVDDPDQNKVAP